jgi:hypothetical protein
VKIEFYNDLKLSSVSKKIGALKIKKDATLCGVFFIGIG